MYNVKEKGGQPDRKPYPLPYGLRNPFRNLKSENSQDYAQKPQQNCMFISRSFLLLLNPPCTYSVFSKIGPLLNV
jgi:hypothetical protein